MSATIKGQIEEELYDMRCFYCIHKAWGPYRNIWSHDISLSSLLSMEGSNLYTFGLHYIRMNVWFWRMFAYKSEPGQPICSGLNELSCLNAWSPTGGNVWGRGALGGDLARGPALSTESLPAHTLSALSVSEHLVSCLGHHDCHLLSQAAWRKPLRTHTYISYAHNNKFS